MTYDAYTKYDAPVAKTYEEDRAGEQHWQAEQAFMASYVSANQLGKVLDMPVGTGRFFEYYGNAKSVVGIDISSHMLREARAKAGIFSIPMLDLHEGDALAVQYPNSSFDTVVCFRLVHLLPSEAVQSLFAELARLSRSRLLVQIYAQPSRSKNVLLKPVRAAARRVFGLFGRKKSLPWSHIQSFSHTRQALLEYARSAGLNLFRCHTLCSYAGTSVEVLEFRR
jgi:ubiquinone/menaquinone biosynthesis C-methylase UbiE